MRAEINDISRRTMLFLEDEEAECLKSLVRLASMHKLIAHSQLDFAEEFLKQMDEARR